MRFTGGIFDVDGVLLDTPHAQAWREALAQLMAGPWHALAPRTSFRPGAFTDTVYQDYVAGMPRAAGAAAALKYFHAAAGDFRAYDDALRFLLQVKASGVRVCAASSSKNADAFLKGISVGAFCARTGVAYPFVQAQTTLLDLLDADVDGLAVPRGKPDPALFLAAARALGMAPGQCFVVEDAAVGIQAAKSGGMYSIGVARHQDADLLRAAGADVAVERLDTIDVHALLA
jgi:beta-phosphoglucomutase